MEVKESSFSAFTSFRLSIENGVVELCFQRPEQHNSMTAAFWKELPAAIDEVEACQAARVLIIRAEGASFSSGMDLAVFKQPGLLATGKAEQRERLQRLVLHLQSVLSRLENCLVPVIAAVQGPCIGAGFDLVSACDLRYASKNAYFSIHEIKLAMMADLGTLQRLPHLMPEGVLRELAFTGDKLQSERAYQLGLVSAVLADADELNAHVKSVAGKIAGMSPLAIRASRQALRYARSHSVEDSLEMAAILQSAVFSDADVMKAVGAQKSGTPASYSDLERANSKI